MSNLNRINGGKFYKILEYVSWKSLTVKYWLEYSKNQYGKRTIVIFIYILKIRQLIILIWVKKKKIIRKRLRTHKNLETKRKS